MTMFKKYKVKLIISSVILLLPILFGIIMWKDLPDTLTTHWGADGNADATGGKAFAVFGLPLIILALHFVCLFFTLSDKKQKEQNPKAFGTVLWILPIISLFINGLMYHAAFGREFNLASAVSVLFGLLFIFIGNYLPKMKQNRTMGIKVTWALNNEENWNKTHRFGGKLWVAGGIVSLLSVFLPIKISMWIIAGVTAAMVIVPVIYSYSIYKQHKKDGVEYVIPYRTKREKIARIIITAALSVILIGGTAILMFTGDIAVHFEENSFEINASYWSDSRVEYSEIDSVNYRKDLDVGVRINGLGSFRLSTGAFRNDEFGDYTLYAYTGAEEFIVLTSDGKTLVIGMKNENDAQAIYESIKQKTDK